MVGLQGVPAHSARAGRTLMPAPQIILLVWL